MGVVYRAHQTSMKRSIALKVLSGELVDDEPFRERFRREATIAAQLDHPNILPVFDSGEADGHLFIVMRLVDGPTMGDLVTEQGALRWQRVLEILAPIASALDAAGSAGLVHRDVKPQNILISSGGHPYLADFGLMRMTRSSASVTRSGEWLGSPDYAAPEHMTDQAYTTAGDVYSLGAVAYHALTGHLPYERTTDLAVIHAHAVAAPPRITTWNPALPSQIDDVIAWGMDKDPAERPGSASALIERLAMVLRSSPVGAVLVEDSIEAGKSSRASHPTTNSIEGSQRPAPVIDTLTSRKTRRTAPPIGDRRTASPPRRPSLAARAGAGAGALAIAVVTALLIALGGDDKPRQQQVQRTSFALRLPSGWQIDERGALSTLALTQRVVAHASPAIRLDAGLLQSPRGGPDPLPAAHTARWPLKPQIDHVQIGSVNALRYEATLESGLSAERTYVMPTTKGYIVVSCRGRIDGLERLHDQCDRVAGSLTLRGPEALAVGPSPDTARALALALRRLDAARRAHERELASEDRRIRSRAARALATAHAQAAASLRGVTAGPLDRLPVGDLLRSLTSIRAGLTSLAAADSSAESAGYAAARARIRSADRVLDGTLSRLQAAGYRVAVSQGR